MKRSRDKYAKSLDQSISYQTLPSTPKGAINNDSQKFQRIIRRSNGEIFANNPSVSSATTVDLISNAGVVSVPDEKNVPNEYEFEILRLHRRVEELENAVRDRDARVVKAISRLEDELQMFRTLMHTHVGETYGGIQRRIIKLESTLVSLREKGSQFIPPLEIPTPWKKKI